VDLLERLQHALADHYRLEHELGRGGMATVYLAQDLKHARRVALKVLRPEIVPALGADRFLREIAIAARLQHPHILEGFHSWARAAGLRKRPVLLRRPLPSWARTRTLLIQSRYRRGSGSGQVARKRSLTEHRCPLPCPKMPAFARRNGSSRPHRLARFPPRL
jgi:serine/threonine protein kinase